MKVGEHLKKYYVLNRKDLPENIKTMSFHELSLLCAEIRDKIINTISETGGHMASSLGVVELTVALYKVFGFPEDKLIWDVGHQSYAHKLITNRFERFDTIRQRGGLAGFTRQSESRYDAFISGHSSISISAASGICKAGELLDKDYYTVAVIGDGSLTGGIAYEGLNNAKKNGNEKLIVVLNDNDMSISKNVGAMSKYLSKIRNAPSYFKTKDFIKDHVSRIPVIGAALERGLTKSKVLVKESIYHSNMFENLGFEYLGPVDGHDLDSLVNVLSRARELEKPVFVHVKTVKGKGYSLAEQDPAKYHGVSKPCKTCGCKPEFGDFSAVFGDEIAKIAEKDKRIVAITAAMKNGTGLDKFAIRFPNRFFDVGIAEQHAVTFAAGLAAGGCLPIFAVYSSFLQRSLDQVIHDAAIENQHIVLAIDRAGVVGEDGETHQGVFDVSFLSMIPNVTILSPSSYEELRRDLNKAIYEYTGVVAVRYPRGKEEIVDLEYEIKKASCYALLEEKGNKTLIVTYGRLMNFALKLKESLGLKSSEVSILKLGQIWPIDEEVVDLISGYERVLFLEEAMKSGGIGEHIATKLLEREYRGKYMVKGIEKFVSHAAVEESLSDLGFRIDSLLEFIS